jgi:hypothetical protein
MADIQFPSTFFDPGTFTAVVNDNNNAPSTVLDAGQPFTISTTTDLSENARIFLGGTLDYAAYVEAIGPGVEQQVGATESFVLNNTSPINVTITVPANTLPDNLGPGQSGAYKLVVLMTHRNVAGVVTDIAAVVEGPVLRIS